MSEPKIKVDTSFFQFKQWCTLKKDEQVKLKRLGLRGKSPRNKLVKSYSHQVGSRITFPKNSHTVHDLREASFHAQFLANLKLAYLHIRGYPLWNEQIAPEKMPCPKRKRSSSDHPFSDAMLVSWRVPPENHWWLDNTILFGMTNSQETLSSLSIYRVS